LLLKLRRSTTLHLDKLAEEFIRDHGAVPSFLGLYGFKLIMYESECTSCTRNTKQHPLKSGDVISVDCGAYKNGYHGDHAYSFEIGEVDPEKKLLQITKESLYVGIRI
jgi:methionyl aminopeptidase